MNPVENAANRDLPAIGGVLEPLCIARYLAPVLATPATYAVPGVQAIHDHIGPPITAMGASVSDMAEAIGTGARTMPDEQLQPLIDELNFWLSRPANIEREAALNMLESEIALLSDEDQANVLRGAK